MINNYTGTIIFDLEIWRQDFMLTPLKQVAFINQE